MFLLRSRDTPPVKTSAFLTSTGFLHSRPTSHLRFLLSTTRTALFCTVALLGSLMSSSCDRTVNRKEDRPYVCAPWCCTSVRAWNQNQRSNVAPRRWTRSYRVGGHRVVSGSRFLVHCITTRSSYKTGKRFTTFRPPGIVGGYFTALFNGFVIISVVCVCDILFFAFQPAVDAVKALRRAGKRTFFVTNNSSKSRRQYCLKLDGFGVRGVAIEDVITSGAATAGELAYFHASSRRKLYTSVPILYN